MADLEQVRSEPQPAKPPPRRSLSWSTILSVVVGVVGVAALGTSAWVYGETRRDIMRLSTDIAQIRLSLELFNRQQASMPVPDRAALDDLTNRLSIIEGEWRNAPAAAAVPAPAAPMASAPASGDCMPTGTRFMVAAGDSYPVCGTDATVEIGSVDNGYISLGDGTVIAQGGNIALPNSNCMIGVVPMDGGSISGFAEIRVTC